MAPAVHELGSVAPDAVDQLVPAGEDPGVEDGVAVPPGEHWMLGSERHDIGGSLRADSGRSDAERSGTSRDGCREECAAGGAAASGHEVARAIAQALCIFELP